MRLLFVYSGNKNLGSSLIDNQAKSIQEFDKNIELYHYKIIGKGLFGYLGNLKKLRNEIKRIQPDIIHSHYSFSGYLAVLATTSVPVITSLMGSDVQISGIWKVLLKIFSKRWKIVIVKSDEMKQKCELSHALVIPNGVNLSAFNKINKTHAKEKLKLNPDKKYILFLADPARKEKNFSLAKKSVELLKDNKVELLVAHNIPFHEVIYYYYAVDVVLMTSVYEGSPNVIKEAMACNKPIVCTRVGDVGLLLKDLAGCFVVEHSTESVSEALKKAVSFEKETEGCERLINLNLDSVSVAGKIISCYHEALGIGSNQNNTFRRCIKGVWDSTIPGISFNQEGVSNYCLLQEKMMNDYPRGEVGKKEWENIVSKIKKSGASKKYDCIVGVSGGVDSSFLLHLAKHYGLRPLAVHLDNGFNSEIAVSNIEKITKQLQIDLFTYVINYEEIKDILKAYMKASLPWIDAATDLAIKSVMYDVARKNGIKYLLRGNDFRSEGKQPTEWTYSDNRQLKYIHKKFGTGVKLKSYPTLSVAKILYSALIFKIRDVRPYYYIDYKKSEAKNFLISNYHWVYYGGHHHENLFTKFAMAYWLPYKFNIDKRKINLSAQILSGEISREEALHLLEKPFDSSENLESLKEYVCKKLELKPDDFNKIINLPNKRFSDYPSNFNLIYNNIKHVKWLLKRIYGFKPMSVDSKEMIK